MINEQDVRILTNLNAKSLLSLQEAFYDMHLDKVIAISYNINGNDIGLKVRSDRETKKIHSTIIKHLKALANEENINFDYLYTYTVNCYLENGIPYLMYYFTVQDNLGKNISSNFSVPLDMANNKEFILDFSKETIKNCFSSLTLPTYKRVRQI